MLNDYETRTQYLTHDARVTLGDNQAAFDLLMNPHYGRKLTFAIRDIFTSYDHFTDKIRDLEKLIETADTSKFEKYIRVILSQEEIIRYMAKRFYLKTTVMTILFGCSSVFGKVFPDPLLLPTITDIIQNPELLVRTKLFTEEEAQEIFNKMMVFYAFTWLPQHKDECFYITKVIIDKADDIMFLRVD